MISYVSNGRTFHAQALPEGDAISGVTFSLDDGKTRFFDLLQMVEFYQLNKGSLNSRLTHFIVREEVSSTGSSGCSSRPMDSKGGGETSSCQASEASMASQGSDDDEDNVQMEQDQAKGEKQKQTQEAKIDTNHNSDANMASDSDSLRDFQQG